MTGAFLSSLLLLIKTVGNIYIMIVLIRFILQIVKADFYNPISQGIVKLTSPLLVPLRKIIPSILGIDIAALVLAFILQFGLYFLLLTLKNSDVSGLLGALMLWSFKELMIQFLDIYTFSLVIIAIASWIVPYSTNPGLALLHEMTAPLTNRIRNIIPPLGGLDFSLMALLFIIMLLKNFITAL